MHCFCLLVGKPASVAQVAQGHTKFTPSKHENRHHQPGNRKALADDAAVDLDESDAPAASATCQSVFLAGHWQLCTYGGMQLVLTGEEEEIPRVLYQKRRYAAQSASGDQVQDQDQEAENRLQIEIQGGEDETEDEADTLQVTEDSAVFDNELLMKAHKGGQLPDADELQERVAELANAGIPLTEEQLEAEAAVQLLLLGTSNRQPAQKRRPADVAKSRSAHDSWRANVDISEKALLQRATAFDQGVSVGGVSGKEATLVIIPDMEGLGIGDRLAFVHWTCLPQRQGYELRLDDCNRIIYAMPAVYAKHNLAAAEVVHPALGARMRKVPEQLRATVPDFAFRLKAMFGACLAAKDGTVFLDSGSDESMQCSVCGVQDSEVARCCFCCCLWHAQCCAEVCLATATLDLPESALTVETLRRWFGLAWPP
jgi:hypothetical protein